MPGNPGRAQGERRFGFGARLRLTRKADFERLLRTGERRSLSGYTFYIARREQGEGTLPRLGMLVSRKHARKATDRNRIKRCIREAFRAEQAAIGALDILVRPPLQVTPGRDMMLRLRAMFSRLAR